MPDLLFLHDLDDLVHTGCADPDCRQTHTDGLAWRPPCHPDAGLAVSVELAAPHLPYAAELELACGDCHTALWTIACLDGHVWYAKGDPTCAHDDNDLHVGYAEGQVTVGCRRCAWSIVALPVAAYSEERD